MKSSVTTDQREWVKDQWKAGRSASDIAGDLSALLQVYITRNVVIGIVTRAGLQRGPGAAIIRLPRAPYVPKPPRAMVVVLQKVVPDPDLAVTMADVEKCHCRWPVEFPGEARFLYCGRQRLPGGPFCEGHAAEGYQPKKERKK